MNGYNNLILPGNRINGANNTQNIKKTNVPNPSSNADFESIFEKKINQQNEDINNGRQNIAVQFSKHANMRLSTRDINLSEDQIKRIETGVNTAREKGIKDSLVLVDDIALVVNVGSRTVVTALNNQSQNIFTNIDGAVIV